MARALASLRRPELARLRVEDGENAGDRPAADRAHRADKPRRTHGTQATVAARGGGYRRPALQAHHAHRLGADGRELHNHR